MVKFVEECFFFFFLGGGLVHRLGEHIYRCTEYDWIDFHYHNKCIYATFLQYNDNTSILHQEKSILISDAIKCEVAAEEQVTIAAIYSGSSSEC